MFVLVIKLVTSGVVAASAVFASIQLARNKRDLPLRVIVPALWGATVASSVGIPVFRNPLDAVLGGSLTMLVNIGYLLMVYGICVFLRVANEDEPRRVRSRRAVLEFVPCALAMAWMLTLWLLSPPAVQAHPVTGDSGQWQTTLLVLGVHLYELPAWIVAGTRAVSFARRTTFRWVRRALSLVVLGIAGLGYVAASSFITIPAHYILPRTSPLFKGELRIYDTALLGGHAMLALALLLASVAAAAVTIRNSLDHRAQEMFVPALRPLWRLLVEAFPYIVLPPEHQTSEAIKELEQRLDFTQATSEIDDGLAYLAPYFRAGGLTDDTPGGRQHRPVAVAAQIVADSLDVHRIETPSLPLRSDPPHPVLTPEFSTWRDRARWMAQLSDHVVQRVGQTAA